MYTVKTILICNQKGGVGKSTLLKLIAGLEIPDSGKIQFDGDIITVGLNYQLFLILLDATKLNLAPTEGFMPAEQEPEVDPFQNANFGTTRIPEFGQPMPPAGGWGGQGGGMASSSGTVGMDGMTNNNRSGGTMV